MNINKLFYSFSSLILLIAAFIYLSPALISNDFIYPIRIDSTYIRYHSNQNNLSDTTLLNPGNEELIFQDLNILSSNGLELQGWYVPTIDTPANTIVIIHDINQSKIMVLDHIRQLHDRGFHVYAFDLRAHGTSEGTTFTPGLSAVEDMKVIIDSLLQKQETKHIILFGMGIGSAIAMQTAIFDGRCDGLILQSPFNNLSTYLNRYAFKKWGPMKYLWYPIFEKKVKKLLQYPITELDLTRIASFNTTPTLFITAGQDDEIFTSETLQVYSASAAEKKALFLVREANHYNIAVVGGEKYYNKIANFIQTILPKPSKKTRFKKLAFK